MYLSNYYYLSISLSNIYISIYQSLNLSIYLSIIPGGGQERGLRSGTLSPALCVGMGEAARLCKEDYEYDKNWIKYLSKKLLTGIQDNISHTVLNGDPDRRYPGNVNVSFAYVEGESLLMALKNIAVSSGSACTSASLEPSYVLRAIGMPFIYLSI
jgi:cysteine desulfurase